MKMLFAYTSHVSSTYDVARYYHMAFEKLGVNVKPFVFYNEFLIAGKGLQWWESVQPSYMYTDADAVYIASKNLMADVAFFQPDVVVLIYGLTLDVNLYHSMKTLRDSLKKPFLLVSIQTEGPYQVEQELNCAFWSDMVFNNERPFVDRLRQVCKMSYWLPQAYEDTIHYPGVGLTRDYADVYFCGSGHRSRLKTLEGVDWTGIDFKLEGYFHDIDQSPINQYCKNEIVANAIVADRYRTSKVCLNVHRAEGVMVKYESIEPPIRATTDVDIPENSVYNLNNRFFEIAACQTVQLVDATRMELRDSYRECPTYSTADEIGVLARWYLGNSLQAERVAKNLYALVEGRTYLNNAKTVLRHIESAI